MKARILERQNGLGKKRYTIQFRAWYGWTTQGTGYYNYRFDTIDEARLALTAALREIQAVTYSAPTVVETFDVVSK